jgi:hypothetical protein
MVRSTADQWRRFLFDYIAGHTTTRHRFRLWNTGADATETGKLWLDDLSVRRIWRWNLYAPRIGSGAIPELEIVTAGPYFAGKSIGVGSITLIDGDGELAKALDGLLMMNAPANVYVGGFFPDGQAVHRDDWRGTFPALVHGCEVQDGQVILPLQDGYTLAKDTTIPPRVYSVAENADLDPNAEGKRKAWLFGNTRGANIVGVRVDLNTSGYGQYDILDPSTLVFLADNARRPDAVVSYPNEELADLGQKGLTLGAVSDYDTAGSGDGWVEILRDVRNYRYDRAGNDVGTNSSFDFDIGGGALVANVDIAGTATTVAALVQAAMRAVGAGDETCTYSDTTHKFTVGKAAGTLNLRPHTGATKQKQSWKLLGFDIGSDKTGALSYVGDEATFTNPETDHVLRFQVKGFRDKPSSPIIINSASDELDSPAAVVSLILQAGLNVQPAKIDLASFTQAHNDFVTADGLLRAYFDKGEPAADLISLMEMVGLMDVTRDGEGLWRVDTYSASSTGAREFFDRDYLSWRMWKDPRHIYKSVRVLFAYSPMLGRFLRSFELPPDAGAPIKLGAESVLEIPTWWDDDGGLAELAVAVFGGRIADLASLNPWYVEFRAAGKLVDLRIGSKVKLTKSPAADVSGSLSAAVYRIIGLRHNYLSGVSTCTAVEDVNWYP